MRPCFSLCLASLAAFGLLTASPGAQSSTRSWTFEELLRPPSARELERVDREWTEKRWDVRDAKLAGTTRAPVGSEQFDARLYVYTFNGSPRCGAILLPPGAAARSLAGLVDVGDIRWDYPDRDLTNGPYVARILGDRAREIALVVPCPRGTGLRVAGVHVRAGGDRRDAWEGVAEDTIGFLTVALSTTPQIDPARLGVYGYSRGGGVALIVGQRDTRIKAVLAFAAPTDWFSAMARPGENWPARMEAALRDAGLRPDTREHQFLDFFVRDREALPLSDLRRRLAAASPLYFAAKLPAVQVHHGELDAPVPVLNATWLRDRLGAQSDSRKVFIYAGAGHLLDETTASSTARQFLVERIIAPR